MKRIADRIVTVLGSRQFLYVVLAFFVLESLWIALSAVYPMAFDEDFHFGIINIYTHHWLPFLAGQPDGAAQFGAVARDPSFLYHWLMSFSLRLVSLCTDNQTAQIICLRIINIGIFTTALVSFAQLMRKAGSSRPLINTGLALFVLIPVVPLLAGQINYDSLFLLFVAYLGHLVYALQQQLKVRKPQLVTVTLFLTACMLGSITKYAFLPIALVAFAYVSVLAIMAYRNRAKQLRKTVASDFRRLRNPAKLGLVLVLIASSALFVQRYVPNMVAYHTPVPDCAEILSDEDCSAYGPWARDTMFKDAKGDTHVGGGLVPFIGTWLQGMHYRLFFMINGPYHNYANTVPVPLPSATAMVIGLSGLVALLLFGRVAYRGSPFLWYLTLSSLFYVGVLFVENYSMYLRTGQPVAINGRYLLPVILALIVIMGKALHQALKAWPTVKPFLAVLAILLFLQGGGVFSFILRSDSSWHWPSSAVTRVNYTARRVLEPVIFEGSAGY